MEKCVGTSVAGTAALSIRRSYLGVFLTSAAVLLLQISLTRIFSYTIWYHFTYLTISLAMLGFGASGAVLASSKSLASMNVRLAHRSSLMAAVSVPITLIVVSKIPFAPFQLFQQPVQLVYLFLYYIAVTLPFFCAGLTIACVFKSRPADASSIYFCDLLGAGAACLVIVYAINLLGVPAVAAFAAVLFLSASALFLTPMNRTRAFALAAAAVVVALLSLNVERFLQFSASEEKWISRMAPPNIEFTKWSPIFRIDTYTYPFTKEGGPEEANLYGIKNKNIPDNLQAGSIAHDGDACALMWGSDKELSTYAAFDRSILKIPYLLLDQPDVLVIGPGGGIDVGVALRNQADSVLAVELDPITVDLVTNKYADLVGNLYQQPGVRVVADEGRSFLRRSDERYDIIQMTGVDTLAALNSGAYVLAENYLYTVEAYGDFLERLNPDGFLSVAIFDCHYSVAFPRQTARQASLSLAALRTMAIQKPQDHIAIISNKRESRALHVLILTKKSPFTFAEIKKIVTFANEESFDICYVPGRPADNQVASMISASDAERNIFYKEHPLQVAATTDDSPFFFHYYKWATLLKDRQIDPGHTMATGQIILLLVLVFSILFSVILIVFPLYKFQRTGLQTRRKWNYILYFAALGLGFIFIEVSYIQRFILFLGYPTYSLTVILFSLLTFSGIGSYLSGKVPLKANKLILVAVLALSVVALGYLALLPPIFNVFLGSPKNVRILVSLALLFPLGLLMGVFFPTGIKIISRDDSRFIPWAWGVNGCASVIGAILSIIIAMSYGFTMVTVLAVAIYIIGISALVFSRTDEVQADSSLQQADRYEPIELPEESARR